MVRDFKKFVLRGNLLDLAIGFTVGASFSTVAKSLVTDIIMPPISVFLNQSRLVDTFFVLRQGDPLGPYESVSVAEKSGAITLNYGKFLDSIFALLIVAIAMFVIINLANRAENSMETFTGRGKESKKSDEPALKKCPYCLSKIAYRATRCSECTSKLAEKTATKRE